VSCTGTVDGYAAYDANDHWAHNRPDVTLEVHEMIAASDGAYRDLWRYLCQIDWVASVRGHVRPLDEPLRHLLVDGRATWQTDRSDQMWVRLLDPAAALVARRYEAPVSAVLEIVDTSLGRGGRFRFEAGPDGASCEPTSESADVVVPVDVLGAAYLGGTPVWPFVVAGRVEECTPGVVASLERALRSSRAPWATTRF
jgi:predicted acetyltransferase